MTPLVIGPKNPTAGVILLAFWKRTNAALVLIPNILVSNPNEPGPVSDTGKP